MELTNHTYLRSRVDMQLADSLRKKASNKISAGALGNARENAGGFSAGIRFKSNQYLLQSRRANIQNSLSYLQVQRNAIMEARDIMERIALTKIKFSSPTINQTDRNNYNLEFKELTDELISLRERKFNGVSLFTPTSTSSSELFGSSRSSLETGSGSNNGVGISQHVIDYQDVRNIYDAGDGVQRGVAGLDVVNFEIDPVQRQIEKITIGGDIAAGDIFRLNLNELSSIREIESTHSIVYQATAADEALADVNGDGSVFDATKTHEAVRDELITRINNAAATGVNGQFVTATADGSSGILITSEGEGDPFELWNVGSSGDAVSFNEEATPTTPNIANDAEEAIIRIDLKENAQNTGLSVRAGDSVTVHIKDSSGNLQPFTYTVGASDLTDANFSSNAGTDPQNEWLAASTFLLNGLANTISNEKAGKNVKVDAGVPTTWSDGSQLILRSEERGVPLDIVFNNDDTDGVVNLSLTRPAQTATASTLVVNLPRDVKEGDTFRLSGMADGTDSTHMFDQADFTATYSHGDNYVLGGTTKTISDRATLAEAISTHADIASATIAAGNNLTITANINALDDQPKLSFGQEGVDGELLGVPGTQNQAAVGKTVYNSIQTWVNRNDGGGFSAVNAPELDITLNTDGTNKGHASTVVNATNNGSNIAVGDSIRVRGSQLSGSNGVNDYRYNVTAIQNGQVTDVSYASTSSALVDAIATNIGTSGGGGTGLTLNIAVSGTTVMATVNTAGNNSYVQGNQVTVSGENLGGFANTLKVDTANTGTHVAAQTGNHTSVATDQTGLVVDFDIDAGGNVSNVVIRSQNASSGGLTSTSQITIDGALFGGTGTGDDLVLNVDQWKNDLTLDLDRIEGDAQTVTFDLGNSQNYKSSFSYSNKVPTTSGSGLGLQMDYTIDRAGNVTGVNLDSNGEGFSQGEVITLPTVAWDGDSSGADNPFTTAPQFTVQSSEVIEHLSNIGTSGQKFTFVSGTLINGNHNNAQSSTNGVQLDLSVSAGVPSINSVDNGGTGLDIGDTVTFPGSQVGGVDVVNDLVFRVDSLGVTSTSTVGTQYAPDSATHKDTNLTVTQNNVVGQAKVLKARFTGDNGTGGMIAPGDTFTVRIDEILHADETNGSWPESGSRAALSTGSITVTAQAGQSTDEVADNDGSNGKPLGLVQVINNYIQANFSAEQQKHLPVASYDSTNKDIIFTAAKAGEDFDITVSYTSSADSMTGTGTSSYSTNPSGKGDPSGMFSHVKNISPFSIPKSISYFEEMLAQNEAETSRLMKAMEHLENSMVHNEDALSKVQDTDYSQASVEQMRNAVKMQMANNVIGKSMRMNDLLIDLATKHHRGSMLDAKA